MTLSTHSHQEVKVGDFPFTEDEIRRHFLYFSGTFRELSDIKLWIFNEIKKWDTILVSLLDVFIQYSTTYHFATWLQYLTLCKGVQKNTNFTINVFSYRTSSILRKRLGILIKETPRVFVYSFEVYCMHDAHAEGGNFSWHSVWLESALYASEFPQDRGTCACSSATSNL